MIIFLGIFAVILLVGCRITPIKQFNNDYMSKDNTNTIKGIFVILVFFSHCTQYIGKANLVGPFDAPYVAIQSFLGQMIVSAFLFYSGYGIMESITKKGFDYVKSIPVRRIFKTLINFDMIVLLFLILDLIFKETFSIKRILLSFVAWDNINNSNWYILAILLLYIVTFLSFIPIRLSKKRSMQIICAVFFTILTAVLAYILFKANKESWYYNTLFIYPLGIWYSILKPYIDKIVMKNIFIYCFILIIGLAAVIFTHLHKDSQPYLVNNLGYSLSIPYTIWSLAFTLFVVLLSMKIKIKSFTYSWLGAHIFSVYMLQRVPMLILKKVGLCDYNKYLFIVISFAATIPLAIVFDKLINKMWSKLKI